MKTIGEIFSQKRRRKKLSTEDIARGTKIRREFIEAIEKGKWNSLPEHAVLSGFIKNIADFLGIDSNKALAIFKRDYPPRRIAVNPKPDVQTNFAWSPKLTFILGSVILALGLFGYLGFQYFGSINPPQLEVSSPSENAIIEGYQLEVSGSTSPDATITANNQPILVSSNGEFKEEIDVTQGTSVVVIVATSRNGKSREIVRSIKVEVPN